MRITALLVLLLSTACARVPELPTHIPAGRGWQCGDATDPVCDRACISGSSVCHSATGAWCYDVESGDLIAYQCAESEADCNALADGSRGDRTYVSLCGFEP